MTSPRRIVSPHACANILHIVSRTIDPSASAMIIFKIPISFPASLPFLIRTRSGPSISITPTKVEIFLNSAFRGARPCSTDLRVVARWSGIRNVGMRWIERSDTSETLLKETLSSKDVPGVSVDSCESETGRFGSISVDWF
jgi:hypothetical protein